MLTTSFPRYRGDYVGIFVYELAKELVQRGNNVTIIAPHTTKSLRSEMLDGVEIVRFRYFFPLFMQRLAYGSGVVSNIKTSWLAKIQIPFFVVSCFLRALGPSRRSDIIHAHWAANGFVGVLLKWIFRKPLIITLHGSDVYYFSRNTIFKSVAKFILRRASSLIVVSKEIEAILIAMNIDKSKITVVHNGVSNIDEFLNLPMLKQSNNRLLWIGRFVTEKNPLYALQIFKKVLESIPSAQLTMVGDGPEQQSCRQYCEQHALSEHVTFVGKKDHRDIPKIFSQHSVLMLTSRREGLPLTVLEALAAGRPVVATHVGGIPEVVHNGVSGYVVRGNEVATFSKRIVDLLLTQKKYQQFAERAREFVSQHHTWNRIAASTEKIYKEKKKKAKKVLILNGSIHLNIGDAAILAGNIVLLKKYFPEVAIWGLSPRAKLDEQKFGIHFLPIAPESLNPFDFIKLLRCARTSDAIFWGGGEVLKDYTNKLGLVYWVVKIFCIWLVNKNIFGAFQGIGPTQAVLSKKLIIFIVNRTKIFFVRDKASKEKLASWGCKATVVESHDPAILIPQKPIDTELISQLQESNGFQKQYLDNYVGIAPRNWFHYTKGGWLPHRYREMIGLRRQYQGSPDSEIMYQRLAELADWVIKTYHTRILFFPMNIAQAEGDGIIAQKIVSKMQHADQTCIIKAAACTPYDYVSMMAKAKFFIGVRLHSTILSTAAGVPSITFYYVDKGREYFKQIKSEQYSFPIESIIQQDNLEPFQQAIQKLWDKDKSNRAELVRHIDKMKKEVIEDFSEIRQYLDVVHREHGQSIKEQSDFYNRVHKTWEQFHELGSPTYILRKSIIKKSIKKSITKGDTVLDLGCGSGDYIEILLEDEVHIDAVDFSDYALQLARKRYGNNHAIRFIKSDIFSFKPDKKYNLILISEVLEHIDNDSEILCKIGQWLTYDGRIVVSMPYSKKLWSYSDEFSGHKRRYDKSEVVRLDNVPGLTITKKIIYGFPLLWLYWWFTRTMRRKITDSNAQKFFFSRFVVKISKFIFRLDRLFVGFPWGVGIIIMFRKKHE